MADKFVNRRVSIYINGKEVENNMRSIQQELRKTQNEFKHLTKGTTEYNKKAKEIQQLQAILDQHTNKIKGVNKAWESFKTIFLGTFASNIAQNVLQRLVSFIPGVITGAGKLDDSLADIRKTTGQTSEEVEVLNNALGKIDTRTSREELREIAVVAGQLGIAKEDVLGFVDSVDKLAVALGDEFAGGAAEVTDKVGRLRNVLKDINTGKVSNDLLYLGNALNELAANGSATAPVIVDFANRIGGVGVNLGLTSGQVLGISAALQELSVGSERGGTAVVKILQKMTQETDTFAKIAGLSTKNFTDLVNKDLYGAFKLVLAESKKSGGSATALSGIIKELEVSGAGASEVFSKLGIAIDFMDEKVLLATESTGQMDSILDEFNIKNSTLGATIDKLSKDLNSLFTSSALTNAIKSFFGVFINGVAWIKRNADAIKFLGSLLWVGVKAWIAYKTVTMLSNLWLSTFNKTSFAARRQMLLTNASIKSAGTVQTFFAAGTARATVAWRSFTASLAANPFTAILTGITLVVSAFQMFRKEVDAVENLQKRLDLIGRKRADDSNVYREGVKEDFGYLKNLKLGTSEYQAELDKINKKYGIRLTMLGDEIKMSGLLAKTKRDLIDAESKASENEGNKQSLDLTNKQINDLEKKIASGKKGDSFRLIFPLSKSELKELNDQLVKLKNDRDAILERDEKLKYGDIIPDNTDDNTTTTSSFTPTEEKKKKEKPYDPSKEIIKIQESLLDAQKDYREKVEEIAKASTKRIEEIERDGLLSGLEGTALVLKELEFRYDDLKEAAQDSFEKQSQAFKDGVTAQLKALDELDAKNEEEKKEGKISPQIFAENQKKIAASRKKVFADANDEELKQKNEQVNALLQLDNAYLREQGVAKGKAAEETALYIKEVNARILETVNTLQVSSAQQRLELEIQRKEYRKYRSDLNTYGKLASDEQIAQVSKVFDEEIALTKKKAKEAKEILKDQYLYEELIDNASELETLKQNQIDDIIQQFEEERRNKRLDSYRQEIEDIQNFVNMGSDIYGNLATIRENKENGALNRFKKRTNRELTILQAAYDSKEISYEEYIAKKTALDNELANKENALKVKQFRKQKAADAIQASINGILAVTRALSNPPGPPYNLPIVIATGIAAGVQVGAILSQPVPEFGDGAYFKDGPKHSDPEKGLAVVNPRTGKVEARVEQGEVLLSSATVENNPELVWPLLDASKKQGGKRIVDTLLNSKPPALALSQASRAVQFANGNYFSSSTKTVAFESENSNVSSPNAVARNNEEMLNELKGVRTDLKTMCMKIDSYEREKTAVISNTQLKESNKDEQIRKQLATLGKVKFDNGTNIIP